MCYAYVSCVVSESLWYVGHKVPNFAHMPLHHDDVENYGKKDNDCVNVNVTEEDRPMQPNSPGAYLSKLQLLISTDSPYLDIFFLHLPAFCITTLHHSR